MKFTMPVSKVVATKAGHTIEFIKGVPTHVPKEAWREVQAAGAVPENPDEVQEKRRAAKTVVDDPVERRERIFAAFTDMVETNRRGDFGASGNPSQAALEKRLGFDIDPKERDELWAEFRQLSSTGEDEALKAKEAAAAAEANARQADADAAKAAAAATNDAAPAPAKGKGRGKGKGK